MASDDSKIIPSSPQTDTALNIKDPSNIDDSAQYIYDAKTNFSIDDFSTAIQDTNNLFFPAALPNKLAPSSSPFILKITGSGFSGSPFLPDPFKIYANIGDNYSIIPPLPTSTDLSNGRAYGYIVKSDTEIWIYFIRLLAQRIWFTLPSLAAFTGADVIDKNKIAIETGDKKYPYLDAAIPNLMLYFSANNGEIKQHTGLLNELVGTSKSIPVTQSPYVVTVKDSKVNGTLNTAHPISSGEKGSAQHYLDIFGHGTSNKNVMMFKTSSSILKKNPTVLPSEVLNNDQSKSAIQSMKLSDIVALEYYKEGNFLGGLNVLSATKLRDYNYFLPSEDVTNSGKNILPDELLAERFIINTLPSGTYIVVIYDKTTGVYGLAPDFIVFDPGDSNLQIHSVSPDITTLQNPKFILSGFNFPTKDDVDGGTSVSISITDSSGKTNLFGAQGTLSINKQSPQNDVHGNGIISLDSASQTSISFSALNITTDNTKMYLSMKTADSYGRTQFGVSPIVIIQAPPTISFITNVDSQPSDNSKSIVRIDQKTGQVIAYGAANDNNFLYIVGQNFGSKKDLRVLFNGQAQTIADLIRWNNGDDPTLSAIQVITQENGSIKGDATIEIKAGAISSEPFILIPKLNKVKKIKKIAASKENPGGSVIAEEEDSLSTEIFKSNIPYDQTSSDYTLWNSKNTKVASSLAVKLKNESTKKIVELKAGLSPENATSISFVPDTIIVPANTPLSADGTLNITFNFYGAFNVNFSSPKIVRLQHKDGTSDSPTFKEKDVMTVVGTGFTDGTRCNINNTGWQKIEHLRPDSDLDALAKNGSTLQFFDIVVPPPNSTSNSAAFVRVSNDQDQSVSSAHASGNQNGSYKVNTIVLNDKYSPLLKINQRLPAGIKMYAKGPQVAMTDIIDANMSIYTQITPFLAGFKTLLIVIRIIVCIIDVICALINPFSLIVAIIALMDCIIDLLSLFPQLAVPIMILSFLQNFVQFLLTFIQYIETYVLSIVNSQLALVKAQIDKDLALLAASEQQAFAAIKQIRDVIAFLEPALQVIQIFKDLLNFAMHFPCAGNQGGTQDNNRCPPANIQSLINNADDQTDVEGTLEKIPGLKELMGDPGILAGLGMEDESRDIGPTLSTMFCQAVAIQTTTLQTMPGFNGLTTPILTPGSTSVVPNITPILPNVSAAIECMNLLTDNIENALNVGQTYITTAEQGQKLVSSYTQCVQNLIDETNQALGDVCGLAISSINSELKVSPKGSVAPDLSDDFIRTKIPLPTTQPNDQQDAGLTLDLAALSNPTKIPETITTDPNTNNVDATLNFGLKKDIYTPVIVKTTNKSGQRQSINTIYFNSDNADVGGLIVPGDILEIVGGTFNGLQFPILGVQQIFAAVRLTCKLDITFEQKLLVGEQPLPGDLSGFDVKVIAHLAGNDAVAVVPADNESVATVQIIARDHHGHELGAGLANKVAIKIESGDAVFVPINPTSTTDVTGVIQEQGTHYIANLKTECSGIVIVSSSVCGVEFQDVGYHAKDPNHAITTRKKTVKIIFTPPIPKPGPGAFAAIDKPQVPGTDIPN